VRHKTCLIFRLWFRYFVARVRFFWGVGVREQGKEGGLTIHDYNYNTFDQEPRPYSYGV